MVTFKYDEIPFGTSRRQLEPDPEEFDFDGLKVEHIQLIVDFTKNQQSVTVFFTVDARAELICDRSLDAFTQNLNGTYQITFKIGVDPDEEADEAWRPLDISANKIEIGKEVRDTILLSVPVKKLHPRYYDEDGQEIPFEQSFPDEPRVDPRWDSLKDLKNRLNDN